MARFSDGLYRCLPVSLTVRNGGIRCSLAPVVAVANRAGLARLLPVDAPRFPGLAPPDLRIWFSPVIKVARSDWHRQRFALIHQFDQRTPIPPCAGVFGGARQIVVVKRAPNRSQELSGVAQTRRVFRP